ncbi:S1 RNA-binding domain-containing protein [Streptomyces griseosporeus]|uniref:S1 RNA-binding domain-containing protein n=1 Tax=Streptomyces griseosporeus TaxID=1910 RepID=UPI0037024563
MDSFSAAEQCAEEALADPDGLRYSHVPSLVRFVSGLVPGRVPDDWSSFELAAGVRLTRLLRELGLRSDAERMFRSLADHFLHLTADASETVPLANALAAAGVLLGELEQAHGVLRKAVLEHGDTDPLAAATGSGEADPLATATLWVNLAALELSRGQRTRSVFAIARSRKVLSGLGPAEAPELRGALEAVELELGRHGEKDALARLASSTAAVVRGRGRDDARSLLAVTRLAVTRASAALQAADGAALDKAVEVLEVVAQRLSALLGADHPDALGVQADLAAVHVEAARTARSAARLDRAVSELAEVTGRLDARLGPTHPRSVAALANLVTARVEAVRAREEPGRAQRTAEVLDEEARRAGRLLGTDHPVARIARASWLACRRIAAEDEPLGGGTTMLLTLTDAPRDWASEGAAYRSYAETVGQLRGTRPGDRGRGPHEAVAVGQGVVGRPLKPLKTGALVEGQVVSVGPDGAVVTLDMRGVGRVPRGELADVSGVPWPEEVFVGSRIELVALGREDAQGFALLSRKLVPAWHRLEHAWEKGTMVDGTIVGHTADGLLLDMQGVRAHLPYLHTEDDEPDDPAYPDRVRVAHVIELDRHTGTVVLSRRAWMRSYDDARKVLSRFRGGASLNGRVVSVTDYGAFVDLGDGVDGLITLSELPWKSVEQPSDVVGEGASVFVRIRRIDVPNAHLSLSLG